MPYLKQSTAATILIGPLLDQTDGVTEKTGLTLASTDIQVSKNGGAFANKSDATAPSHSSNGWYSVVLNTTDTGTLGSLVVKIDDAATHLPISRTYDVVTANVWDSLFSTDKLQVDVREVVGSTTAAANQAAALEVIATGTVVTDLGNSQLQFKTDLTSTVTGNYIGRNVILGSGTLDEQGSKITGYDGSSKILTVEGLTGTPAAGATFVIL